MTCSRSLLVYALTAIALLSNASTEAFSQETVPNARELLHTLLKESQQASGIKTLRIRATTTIGFGQSMTSEELISQAGYLKRLTFKSFPPFVFAREGDTAWNIEGGQLRILEGKERDDALADRCLPDLGQKTIAEFIELASEVKNSNVDGTNTWCVTMSRSDVRTELHFEQGSRRLLAITTVDSNGHTTIASDFRNLEGHLFAFKEVRQQDGVTQTSIREIEANVQISDGTFDPPK